jgi:heat shock protein HtpX
MDTSRNIYEQQSANRTNTVLVMLGFILFVGLLGLGCDVFLLGMPLPGGEGHGLFPIPLISIAALLLGSVSAVQGLQGGDRTVLRSAGAVPVDPVDPQFRQLANVVDEMAIAAGIPRPALYVVPDPDPNAFATGRDTAHASIAVTRGLLERLNRDELQGVIAHETGHIRNLDIRLMTVVAALIGTVLLISEFGLRVMRFGGGKKRSSSDKGGGGLGGIVFVVWLVAMLLAPFLSRLLAMAVSRQREYLADASAAELTRNPGALASALEKIDAAAEPTRAIKKGSAHLCIADPLEKPVNEREGTFADLFATHPPIRKRITYLRAMAYTTKPG